MTLNLHQINIPINALPQIRADPLASGPQRIEYVTIFATFKNVQLRAGHRLKPG
jgi:hypothetical protein